MSATLPPFEEIVTTHGPTVLRVCRAVLGPMDADDAWSETFLAALRAYPTLRPGSNVEAWLVTIALRRVASRFGVRYVWHPALFVFAVYMIVLSSITLIVAR